MPDLGKYDTPYDMGPLTDEMDGEEMQGALGETDASPEMVTDDTLLDDVETDDGPLL